MEYKEFKNQLSSKYGDTIDEIINEMFEYAYECVNSENEKTALKVTEVMKRLLPFSTNPANMKFDFLGFLGELYVNTGNIKGAEKVFSIGTRIINKYGQDMFDFTDKVKKIFKENLKLEDYQINEFKETFTVSYKQIDWLLDLKNRIEEAKKEIK